MFGMVTKEMFFDSRAVTSAVDRATRRVFSKFGAYVRTAARSSIRRRKGVSTPGRPPSSHVGLLKKSIFFAYDPTRKSVVVGPAKLHSGTGGIPRLLEEGGRARLPVDRFVFTSVGGRRRAKREVIGYKSVVFQPRPFMGPAFRREQPKLRGWWKDVISGR